LGSVDDHYKTNFSKPWRQTNGKLWCELTEIALDYDGGEYSKQNKKYKWGMFKK
jgi:hypothetical protein